ncbi:MAG: hypothetical protein IH892_15415 [Planctomycetes bacterium]|nr:hypothetical protein [Planctomycetota bacterium]
MSWEIIKEVVDVTSKIATTGIAAFGAWLAWRTFVGDGVQSDADLNLPSPTPSDDQVSAAAGSIPLKLFETRKQTTWLKITGKGLECHLDERRPGKTGGHKWTVPKDEMRRVLSSSDYYVNPTLKINSGLVSIGTHRNWLYSKKLFPEPEQLHHEIARLLRTDAT